MDAGFAQRAGEAIRTFAELTIRVAACAVDDPVLVVEDVDAAVQEHQRREPRPVDRQVGPLVARPELLECRSVEIEHFGAFLASPSCARGTTLRAALARYVFS